MDEESIKEMRSEVSRHHRDFDKISQIVERALRTPCDDISASLTYENALKRIRNIVG